MIMAINVEQTKKYYKDIKQEDLCDCNYCKNYYLQVKDAYPKVAEFLDSIGIDIEKPFETSPLEPDEHGMLEYCICQYIVIGSAPSELSKEIENVKIDISESHPSTDLIQETFCDRHLSNLFKMDSVMRANSSLMK